MNEEIIIQSKRLYVRLWQEGDWEAFHLVMSDPRVHKYTAETTWSMEKTKKVLEWFMTYRRGWEWEPGYFNCPLILRSTHELIGRVGLNPFLEARVPEIEGTVGAEHWGKGYATEIGRAILRYGLEEAGFDEIAGFTHPQHIASRKVMQKIGMRYDGDKTHRGRLVSFYRIGKGETWSMKREKDKKN